MNLQQYTPQMIRSMNYNQIIGLVRETNRTPGGNQSVFEIARRTYLDRESHALDIGTSTGATALELSRLVGCKVIGIDINAPSIEEARRRAKALGVRRVSFRKGNATRLPFPDETFDLVFCGNVTSLIEDKNMALSEYSRVTKRGKYIAAIPMYYVSPPPAAIVNGVRRAIAVDIPVSYRDQAVGLYQRPGLELYDVMDYRFRRIDDNQVLTHVDQILKQDHLTELPRPTFEELRKVYQAHMLLFRENLSFMGYSIVILRRTNFLEDPELFTAIRVPVP